MPGVVAAPSNRYGGGGLLSTLLGAGLSAYAANMTNQNTADGLRAAALNEEKNIGINKNIDWLTSGQTAGGNILNQKIAYNQAADDAARAEIMKKAADARFTFRGSDAYTNMSQQDRNLWESNYGENATYANGATVPEYGADNYGAFNDRISGLRNDKIAGIEQTFDAKNGKKRNGVISNLIPLLGAALTNRTQPIIYPRY